MTLHCLIPYSDLQPLIFTHIKSMWQHEWDENTNMKLHEIGPSVGIHADLWGSEGPNGP